MKNKRLILALFSGAILLSMVREWSAPVVCVRALLAPSVAAQPKH